MGKRLLDKVIQCKGKMYRENGKFYTGIGGAGCLTSKAIKRIQGHHGGAIRKKVKVKQNVQYYIRLLTVLYLVVFDNTGKYRVCVLVCR